jgi:molybdopterin biosynthesis enzyme
MTDAPRAFPAAQAPGRRRTVTLHSPAGKPVAALPALPAAAVVAAAIALAPRLTALAALAGLMRRMSLTVDEKPAADQA